MDPISTMDTDLDLPECPHCGNSVSPPMAAALVRANVPELMTFHVRELRALEAA